MRILEARSLLFPFSKVFADKIREKLKIRVFVWSSQIFLILLVNLMVFFYLIKLLLEAAIILRLQARPKAPRENLLVFLAFFHVALDEVGDELVSRVKEAARDDFEDAKQQNRDTVSQHCITRLLRGTERADQAEHGQSARKDAAADCRHS